MKKKLLLTLGVLAVVALAVTGCTARGNTGATTLPVAIAPGNGDMAIQPGVIFSQQQVGVWVNGEGEVTAVPDIAMLRVGVEAEQASIKRIFKPSSSWSTPYGGGTLHGKSRNSSGTG
jgi:uncharacterized protein YggE